MKSNNQTVASQSNTSEEPCELYNKELVKIHRKYHPMKVNKSLKVDDNYMNN